MLTRSALAAGLMGVLSLTTSGCIEDSDCGICDPDNLILESISGINYASKKVNLLGPACDGPNCPGSVTSGTYFIEDIGPCEDTDEAKESPRGPDEFCKISPLVTAFGIEFVFNNLLDPTSIELVRKRPDNPQLFEVYDWKQRVLEIEGPITRYNGDFIKGGTDQPDQITRLVNLSCIDNLAAAGQGYSHEDYEDPETNPCNLLDPSTGKPRKMFENGTIKSYAGITTTYSNSCDTPDEGADTCCSECDFLLSTQLAKYGLTPDGDPNARTRADVQAFLRNPNTTLAHIVEQGLDPSMFDYEAYDGPADGAIACDPDPTTGDKYIQCANFVPWVNRDLEERTYRYGFCDPTDPGCTPQEFKLPYYDQLRETHPGARPANLERKTAPCVATAQCRSAENGHNLPGTECVGHIDGDPGTACDPSVTEDCVEGFCVAEWFVTCRQQPDLTGEVGFCFDKRFSDRGVGACYRSNAEFDALCDEEGNNCQTAPGNTQLAFCDNNEDGTMTAAECCQDSLGGGPDCDPAFQNLTPVSNYSRNDNLPEPTRDCRCPTSGNFNDVADDEKCAAVLQIGCFDSEGNLRPERAGQYAVKFVERPGGVIYDPAIKGFEFRPADTGNVPRATVEACAEARGLIDDRNREDGWRANDVFITENFEEFDRAMCSGQEYTVQFAVPGDGQFVQDKVGNTLEGKATYTFETPEFHVVPGSGFPTDNLRIGACDSFSVRVSNKYDMSPENVNKVQIWRVAERNNTSPDNFLPPKDGCPEGPVAGGPGCATSAEQIEDDPCRPPCLTVDIADVAIGEVSVQIDPAEFGPILRTDNSYRMSLPGLDSMADLNGPEGQVAYQRAFWDACGMPLVLGGASEVDYLYDFTVDKPKCKEDEDQDNVQLSCDNAPDFFNPDQRDTDGDSIGDVVDLCPTVAGSANNSADSDKDGVGNECDNCRQTINQYNKDEANPPAYMLIRNVPFQLDTDQDGIGDVCDNCVHVANCEEYGPDNPYRVGDPIAFDDETNCNEDLNNDMVGDACEEDFDMDIAAGPVGIGPDDDFDQDGIINIRDACPRQPLADAIACESDDECPAGRKCEMDGICDHLDSDADDVGDICDTCVFTANPMQVMDGQMQEDDEDGDFVGRNCETNNACENRADPRPFGFYETQANGLCCTIALIATEDMDGNELLVNAITGNPLLDPDDLPVRVECSDAQQEAGECRKLPSQVAATPGVLTPPMGCEEALAGTAPEDNRQLTPEDFGGDLQMLWDNLCFLPQFDQDYDGFGDICDLCPFDFDPLNRAFIDPNGKVWPKDGAFCNGDYSIENKCGDEEPTGGTGTGTGGGTAGTGGMDTGGMTGGMDTGAADGG